MGAEPVYRIGATRTRTNPVNPQPRKIPRTPSFHKPKYHPPFAY
jgi:hypothetical protein